MGPPPDQGAQPRGPAHQGSGKPDASHTSPASVAVRIHAKPRSRCRAHPSPVRADERRNRVPHANVRPWSPDLRPASKASGAPWSHPPRHGRWTSPEGKASEGPSGVTSNPAASRNTLVTLTVFKGSTSLRPTVDAHSMGFSASPTGAGLAWYQAQARPANNAAKHGNTHVFMRQVRQEAQNSAPVAAGFQRSFQRLTKRKAGRLRQVGVANQNLLGQ